MIALFKVSPEIRCSGMSSRRCCYGNHAACSQNFLSQSNDNWI